MNTFNYNIKIPQINNTMYYCNKINFTNIKLQITNDFISIYEQTKKHINKNNSDEYIVGISPSMR